VHNGNNQFGDSARPKPGDQSHGGLSALGRAWVAEMNRLGMIVDGSHSSDAAIEQMITLSRTPIVLSHHGPKAIFDHPRNIDDALMRRLARSGGVMFMNTLFLRATTSSDARDSIEERQKGWETMSAQDRRRLIADRTAAHGKEPVPFADFELFMRSMLHAIKVMGVDHVGLGADWDGGGGLAEMKDIVPLPLITARLRKEGLFGRRHRQDHERQPAARDARGGEAGGALRLPGAERPRRGLFQRRGLAKPMQRGRCAGVSSRFMNNAATPRSGETLSFLSEGGEMGRLVRAFDWSNSPLGPARGLAAGAQDRRRASCSAPSSRCSSPGGRSCASSTMTVIPKSWAPSIPPRSATHSRTYGPRSGGRSARSRCAPLPARRASTRTCR
jgi:hypothetical protein